MEEIKRDGGVSSSSAYKLIPVGKRDMTDDEIVIYKDQNPKGKRKTVDEGFQKGGQTYLKQIKYEKRLKKPLKSEKYARPTSWGTFLEKRAYEKIPDADLSLRLISEVRYSHKYINNWTGMPDLIKPSDDWGCVVGDIKCPYSLETFCDKLEALKDIKVFKEEFPADYWQNISNACILESNGIAINQMMWAIYVPYFSELADIQLSCSAYEDPNMVYWIANGLPDELPHILDNQDNYKNINVFTFDIPEEDKNILTERIILANEYLEDEN